MLEGGRKISAIITMCRIVNGNRLGINSFKVQHKIKHRKIRRAKEALE